MSFIIKPINAFLQKDMDFVTKMDPYVYLTIGSKKFRSKTHKSGGKTPYWSDTFLVPALPPPTNLQMKVQLYDEDLIKDDFIGEGWFDLSMLLNFPGKVQSRYIDLIRKGSRCGRILLEMTYNGPYMNQGPYIPQKLGWKQKAHKFIKGYGSKSNYPPNTYNYNTQQPFYNQTNQNPQNYPNTNLGYPTYNQPIMQSQGQNKQNVWNQVKPTVGGNQLVENNLPTGQIKPQHLGYPNQQNLNQKSGW